MSGKGVKRASPGAEEEKNPLGDVDITDEDAVKLQDLQRYYHRVELAVGAFPAVLFDCRECRVLIGVCVGQRKARPKKCSPCMSNGAPL